jgi:protein phosphatase
MGIGGINYIDINPNPLKLLNDDCILLCSDGLYRTLSTEEMIAIIDSCDDMQKAAEMLTSAAINKGKRNQDNTTAVLLKYIENKANTAEM